jgi:outer membrane protein assembly factor BamB
MPIHKFVYAAGDNGVLYCLNAKTGDTVWSHTLCGNVYKNPIVQNGTVFCGAHDRTIYAFDAATGDKKWEEKIDSQLDTHPVAAHKRVYLATEEAVIALNQHTGAQCWSSPLKSPPGSTLQYDEQSLFIKRKDGVLTAIGTESGNKNWCLPAQDSQNLIAILATNNEHGQVLFSCEGSLHSISSYKTSQRKICTVPGQIHVQPALSFGVLYIASRTNTDRKQSERSGHLKAVEATGQQVYWSKPLEINPHGPPQVCEQQDIVYLKSTDGDIFAYNTYTGERIWRTNNDSPFGATHINVQKSNIYVSTTVPEWDSVHARGVKTGDRCWVPSTQELWKADCSEVSTKPAVANVSTR